MVLPLSVDVDVCERPWGNWLLILLTVVAFFVSTAGGVFDAREGSPFLLDGLGIGVFGHVFLHADVMHLIGNMLFLWVFGNAVCARVGSGRFFACYALFAIGTAVFHLLLSGGPAIGASGAVNGVVGMFFVFHPKDYVKVGLMRLARVEDIPAWLLVGFWLLLDLTGLLSGSGGVAYAGHLGGLLAGISVALFLLKTDRVEDPPGPTVLDLYWRR